MLASIDCKYIYNNNVERYRSTDSSFGSFQMTATKHTAIRNDWKVIARDCFCVYMINAIKMLGGQAAYQLSGYVGLAVNLEDV